MLARMWKNLNPHTLLVGMLNGATVTKNSLAAQQLKQLLYDPAILLLDIDPKELKIGTQTIHVPTCSQQYYSQ